MNKPTQGSACLTAEGGHATCSDLLRMCTWGRTGRRKKFSMWSAPWYHHCLLSSSKPSAWGVLLPVSVSSSSHSPSLSSCFSSAEAAASVVQMLEFTALTPNQKDLQQDYLYWVPPGSQMLHSTSELFSINQQNLNCSEKEQNQDNTLKSICTRSQS